MPQPIAAGSFVVPSNTVAPPDLGPPPIVDMAGPLPDMAVQYPAVLTNITVSPTSVTTAGGMFTVTVVWNDNAHVLK
jgi:hypothetical protein